MTIRRAALYIGGASLLVAWFSSAASLSLQRGLRDPPAPGLDEPSVDAVAMAADVQTQARRLKERLASAPVPQDPVRNPFRFRTVERPATPAPRPAATLGLLPSVGSPAEPLLALIGVAEEKKAEGLHRTGLITTDTDELIVVGVGDVVVQRYKVVAIGVDAIELADLSTGVARRLVMR